MAGPSILDEGKNKARIAPPTSLQLSREDFERLARMIHSECGIYLKESKLALVANRLRKRVQQGGFSDFSTYYRYLQTPEGRQSELHHMLDAITTNKTEFFREPRQWRFLETQGWKEIRRTKESSGNRTIRIWSAACSTGQEPYTIAITLLEHFPESSWDIRILASDLSNEVLEEAKRGVYSETAVHSVPKPLLLKHFENTPQGFEVRNTLRKRIEFRRLNLITETERLRGPFDLIFCRNVIIYFSKDTQRELFEKMAKLLAPGGYLFLGHAETLNGVSTAYRYVEPCIYQR